MSRKKAIQLALALAVLLTSFTLAPSLASPFSQDKQPGRADIQSPPTVTIQNAYLKALSSAGGSFVGSGLLFSTDSEKQHLPAIAVNTGSGGHLIAWEDWRSQRDFDIYAYVSLSQEHLLPTSGPRRTRPSSRERAVGDIGLRLQNLRLLEAAVRLARVG